MTKSYCDAYNAGFEKGYAKAKKELERQVLVTSDGNIHPLDAQPQRKKGEWEEIEVIPEAYDIAGVKTWASKMRCNQCGFTTFAIEGHFAQYDFCPSCGADMRGESDE